MTTDSEALRTAMEDVATLRRAVILLAEVVRDTIHASYNHMHVGQFAPPDLQMQSKLNHALEQIDAAASALEQGADSPKPDGSDAGGEGRGVSAKRKSEDEVGFTARTLIAPILRVAPLVYRIDDAAFALGVSERKVWRLIQERKIPSRKIEGSTVIDADDLRSYVKALPIVNVAQ